MKSIDQNVEINTLDPHNLQNLIKRIYAIDKKYSCYFCFCYGISLRRNNSHLMDLTRECGAEISKFFIFFPE